MSVTKQSGVPSIGGSSQISSGYNTKASIPDYLITPLRQTVAERLHSSSIGNKRAVRPVRATSTCLHPMAPTPKLNRSPSKDDIKVNTSTRRNAIVRKESVDDIDVKPKTSKLPGLSESQIPQPQKRLLRRIASRDDSNIGVNKLSEDIPKSLNRVDSPSPSPTSMNYMSPSKRVDSSVETVDSSTKCSSPISVTIKTPTSAADTAGSLSQGGTDTSPSSFVRRLKGAKAAAALTRGFSRQQSTDDFDVVYSSNTTQPPTKKLPELSRATEESPRHLLTDSKLFFRGHVSAKLEVYLHASSGCLEVCCFDCEKKIELERVYLSAESLVGISQQAVASTENKAQSQDRDQYKVAASYVISRIETEVITGEAGTGDGESTTSPSKTIRLRLHRYNEERHLSESLLIDKPAELIPAIMSKQSHAVTSAAVAKAVADVSGELHKARQDRHKAARATFVAGFNLRQVTGPRAKWLRAYTKVRHLLRIRNCVVNTLVSSDGTKRSDKIDARKRLASISNPSLKDLKQLSSMIKPLTGDGARQERWNRRTFNLYYDDTNHNAPLLSPTKRIAAAGPESVGKEVRDKSSPMHRSSHFRFSRQAGVKFSPPSKRLWCGVNNRTKNSYNVTA